MNEIITSFYIIYNYFLYKYILGEKRYLIKYVSTLNKFSLLNPTIQKIKIGKTKIIKINILKYNDLKIIFIKEKINKAHKIKIIADE